MYAHTFIVQGRGHFPTDMLRYDHCFPVDTGGAQLITGRLHQEYKVPDGNGGEVARVRETDRAITLMAYTSSKTWEPTKARWNSFGWGVIDVQPGRKV